MENGYKSVFKNTGLLGGSSMITMVVGMARNKVIALLLGPTGMGMIGAYESLVDTFNTFWGMGLSVSGVRELARYEKVGDGSKRYIIMQALYKLALILGFCSLLSMMLLSPLLSRWSFGNARYTISIFLLSFALPFSSIFSIQNCFLQGFHRVSDIAKKNILCPVIAAVFIIPCYYLLGYNGIVAGMIINGVVFALVSLFFVRKIKKEAPFNGEKSDMSVSPRGLIASGFPLMLSQFLRALATYFSTAIMIRYLGLEERGIYQTAWYLSYILINFILNAVALDFYPRLSACVTNRSLSRKCLCKQIHVAILLGTPLLAAVSIFSPVAIYVLYTRSFMSAHLLIPILEIGMFFKLITIPQGYVPLASGDGKLYMIVECITNISDLALTFAGVYWWGAKGAAFAFVTVQLVYWGMIGTICRRRYQLPLSGELLIQIFKGMLFLGVVLCFALSLRLSLHFFLIGALLAAVIFLCCIRDAQRKMGIDLVSCFRTKIHFPKG